MQRGSSLELSDGQEDKANHGEEAIRSYLREVETPGGAKYVCLRCLGKEKKEWRCCRIDLYPAGARLSEMQGHYIVAETMVKATEIMEESFPGESFVVRFHKHVPSTRYSNIREFRKGTKS